MTSLKAWMPGAHRHVAVVSLHPATGRPLDALHEHAEQAAVPHAPGPERDNLPLPYAGTFDGRGVVGVVGEDRPGATPGGTDDGRDRAGGEDGLEGVGSPREGSTGCWSGTTWCRRIGSPMSAIVVSVLCGPVGDRLGGPGALGVDDEAHALGVVRGDQYDELDGAVRPHRVVIRDRRAQRFDRRDLDDRPGLERSQPVHPALDWPGVRLVERRVDLAGVGGGHRCLA